MAKQSGLGDYTYVSGVDVSTDIGPPVNISCPQVLYEVTDITKSGIERIGGRRDGQISYDPYFNPTGAHLTFSALPTTERILTYVRGLAAGQPSASLCGFQVGYDANRAADGMLTFSVAHPGTGYGLDWGLTFGTVTHTEATSTAALDAGAAVGTTAFGFQAFLQVVALTGTNVIVTMEASSDDAVGDPYASIGAFASATGVGAQRIAATGNVERYVRFTTSGTFDSATVVVQFTRNLTAVTF